MGPQYHLHTLAKMKTPDPLNDPLNSNRYGVRIGKILPRLRGKKALYPDAYRIVRKMITDLSTSRGSQAMMRQRRKEA